MIIPGEIEGTLTFLGVSHDLRTTAFLLPTAAAAQLSSRSLARAAGQAAVQGADQSVDQRAGQQPGGQAARHQLVETVDLGLQPDRAF